MQFRYGDTVLYIFINYNNRCIKGDTCKVPKILGENLDPHDAIDIRAFETSEEGEQLKIEL